ncbi:MAG: anhydro-N-acetylmuramic acid kinase [Candidatus Dadabacteria bacterium]|nr:anhydro-N-acetylmuramic acid kinase [Candidatus Dadabacteria bacterium]NIQ14936.1 anhydro-N-acetylmuramic acid kinase [Candidatus Dadabacteria bacterium]
MNWLDLIVSKKEKFVIGLMSGTSMDGIDAVLIKITGSGQKTEVEIISFNTFDYSKEIKKKLEYINNNFNLKTISDLNFLIGKEFANAALNIIELSGVKKSEIDLIGSHGQTVFHNPPSNNDQAISTLQIGELDIICQKTGITTVGDFRTRDMAANGEGAPLIPYIDYILFNKLDKNIIAQNIGGIANCTFVNQYIEDMIAFDNGPGNSLIDSVMFLVSNGDRNFDKDSEESLKGEVCVDLLKDMLKDPYYEKPPPKSTGKEYFGLQKANELYDLTRKGSIKLNDLLATLVELTAETISNSYEKFIFPYHEVEEIILSGGGSHNPHLVNSLKQKLSPVPISYSNEYGISVDAKEAIGFAILANETVHGIPSNIPSVTGADMKVPLGKICIGNNLL